MARNFFFGRSPIHIKTVCVLTSLLPFLKCLNPEPFSFLSSSFFHYGKKTQKKKRMICLLKRNGLIMMLSFGVDGIQNECVSGANGI